MFGYALQFFLRMDVHLAHDRARNQTLISRGKSLEFWGPYVEEWKVLPKFQVDGKKQKSREQAGWFELSAVKNVVSSPF